MLSAFVDALVLGAGYNTTVVTLGAALLGAAAGAIGVYVLLRRRSLLSDAVGHATLPGLALAFILLSTLTGDGRWMPGLMAGAALSAALGLVTVEALAHRTRLKEDAAIGIVLSVFFGAGVVLMTILQSLPTGRQAGISSYLLGSAASMLRSEAELIAMLSAVLALAVFLCRRRLTLVCFDASHAAVSGIPVRATDMMLSIMLLAVVVISLKVVGVVLSVALPILPAVASRFWTDRLDSMVPISMVLGATGAYAGAALSSVAPGLPTGALIVLALFLLFLFSLLLAPRRGLLASFLRHHALRLRIHQRQGLLALARGEPIYDGLTLRVLRRAGLIRRDGVATVRGVEAAEAAVAEERLWVAYQRWYPAEAAAAMPERARSLKELLPPDMLEELTHRLARQEEP